MHFLVAATFTVDGYLHLFLEFSAHRFCADAAHVGCFVRTVADVVVFLFCSFLGTEMGKARTILT